MAAILRRILVSPRPSRGKLAALAVALGAASAVLGSSAGRAQDTRIHSVLTTIELKACRALSRHPDGPSWQCAGLPGYPVFLAETDGRFFVSAGRNPRQRRASQQTLHAANTIFAPGGTRATLEWRVERPGAHPVPYAMIVRYYTVTGESTGPAGQVLVVSKLTPAQGCHVALIDAVVNANALELARRIADTTARAFDCSKPPTYEGASGKSPM